MSATKCRLTNNATIATQTGIIATNIGSDAAVGSNRHIPCYARLPPKHSKSMTSKRAEHSTRSSSSRAATEPTKEFESTVALASLMGSWAFPSATPEALEISAREAMEELETSDAVVMEMARLANIAFYDKQGNTKDTSWLHNELYTCQRIRQNVIAMTGPGELSVDDVTKCYTSRCIEFLQNELTQEQRRDSKYRIQYHPSTATEHAGAAKVTGPQRSTFDSVLRGRVGSKYVAMTIWQIGLPTPLIQWQSPDLLQSGLEDIVHWLARVAEEMDRRCADPSHGVQERLSGKRGPDAALLERKQKREKLDAGIRDASHLRSLCARFWSFPPQTSGFWSFCAPQASDPLRAFLELSSADQRLLEDYDGESLQEQRARLKMARQQPFRI